MHCNTDITSIKNGAEISYNFLYLLGNNDHYTNDVFKPFYWQSYVTEARHVWHLAEENLFSDKVALAKKMAR